MDQPRTVLAQLLDHLPRHRLRRIAARYGGDHGIRRFTTWDHFLTMAFAQLTRRESLRDIEACLGAVSDKLYRSGLRSARSHGRHPSTPPAPGRPVRVEHEYRRHGTCAYQAAWDVHRPKLFGQVVERNTIQTFRRPRGPGHERRAVCLGRARLLDRR